MNPVHPKFLADPKGQDPWGLILKFRNGVVLVEVEGLGRFRANLVFGQDGGQTFGFFSTDGIDGAVIDLQDFWLLHFVPAYYILVSSFFSGRPSAVGIVY
jgi:hypothetical protein